MTFPRVPLRRVARIMNGGTPPSGVAEYWDGEVPFVTPPDLNGLDGGPLKSTTRTITTDGVAHSGLAPAGSVLLSTRAPIGHIGRLTSPAAFNQGCRALVSQPDHEARFLAYSLVAARADMDARGLGTTFLELSGSSLAQVEVPLVPRVEQRAIADYLDREAAQIDAFIAKNEELITLLTELRAATIGLAVTRGIRRDVPVRSTGVAWLGDVPAHWSVAGLARYASTISGAGFPENEQGIEDAEIAFYKVNALGQADADGVIRKSWDTISRDTARTLRARILPPGTILLAKIGAALLLGRIRRTDRLACIDNNMMAIVPNDDLDARFASYALQTFDFTTLANPGTVPSMDMYALMHRETAVPPLPEQVAIADYLDRRLSGLDAALDTCRRGIQLARERRAALISAAVTGKIDAGVAA